MTQPIHIGSWELRHQKTCLYQLKWKYQLVESSRAIILMTSSTSVNGFSYHMDLNWIHKIICLKML